MLSRLINVFNPKPSHDARATTRFTGRFNIDVVENMPAMDMDRLSHALDVTSEYIWDLDLTTGRLYLSPRIADIFGCEHDNLPISMEGWKEWIHRNDVAGLETALQRHILGITPIIEHDYRVLDTFDNWRVIRSRGKTIRDTSGKAVRVVGIHAEITKQHQMEQRLALLERTHETLRSIGNGVLTTDINGCITFMNVVAEQVTGWCLADAQGVPINSVMPLYNEVTRELLECPVNQCLKGNRGIHISEHTLLINRHGQEIAIADSTSPIMSTEGRVSGVVMVFHDETEKRARTKEMSWQLTHDALTGLVSRREFERRLENLITDAVLNNHDHALLYLDLDQFKTVNDTCGHVAGDELLKQVAALLQEQMRRDDTLGRMGGDEFAALLEQCPSEYALKIAEKLRTAISGFRFDWQGKVYVIGVSIGVVLIGKDSNYTVASALSAADMSCYEAKDDGRNRVHLFQSTNRSTQGKETHSQILTDIRIALAGNKFELLGQRILPLGHDDEDHFEVLLRMQDQYGMLMSPNVFIPVAERYCLMPEIDRWVVRHAMESLAGSKNRVKPVGLSINLSGLSFTESMLNFIRAEILRTEVLPQQLCFEITETAALRHVGHGAEFMRELKKTGCRFSLDDFGVGMSSFSYLRTLPVDIVKIDGSFVRDMLRDDVDNTIVGVINTLGQIMGKQTVAEYVESDEILDALRMIGVDHAQGYAISRPSPLHTLLIDESIVQSGGSNAQLL